MSSPIPSTPPSISTHAPNEVTDKPPTDIENTSPKYSSSSSSSSKVIVDEFGRVREELPDSPIRKKSNPNSIDRMKVSPALIQCYIKTGAHPRTREQLSSSKFYDAQLHIYAWIDATLKEIAYLIADKYNAVNLDDYKLSFKLFSMSVDSIGSHLGVTMGTVHLLELCKDDKITLKELCFKLGSDLLSVALIPCKTSLPNSLEKSPRHPSPHRSRDRPLRSSEKNFHRSPMALSGRLDLNSKRSYARSRSPPIRRRPSYSSHHSRR